MAVNPEAIIYKTYQLRQLEIHRNDVKKPALKESLTMEIRILKGELDQMLMDFLKEKKDAQPKMAVVDRDLADKDIGPEDVLPVLHNYMRLKIMQSKEHLISDPISIAGDYDGFMYILHIEKNPSSK